MNLGGALVNAQRPYFAVEPLWDLAHGDAAPTEGLDRSVEDLLRGIIIQSGNDACIVIAEALGGSEATVSGGGGTTVAMYLRTTMTRGLRRERKKEQDHNQCGFLCHKKILYT